MSDLLTMDIDKFQAFILEQLGKLCLETTDYIDCPRLVSFIATLSPEDDLSVRRRAGLTLAAAYRNGLAGLSRDRNESRASRVSGTYIYRYQPQITTGV